MLESLHDLIVSVAHAQPGPPTGLDPGTAECTAIFNNGGFGFAGAGFRCISQYVRILTFTVISFAASISLIMLMVNGFRYMMGPAVPGGSSDAAKKGISAALMGLVLCLLTYVILDTIIRSVTN